MNRMIKRLLAVVLVASMLLGSNGISYAAEKADGDGIAGTEEAVQTGEAGEEMESPGDTEESEPAYDNVEETDIEDQAQEEADEEEKEDDAQTAEEAGEGTSGEENEAAAEVTSETDSEEEEVDESEDADAEATEGAAESENADESAADVEGADAAALENADAAGADAAANLTAEEAAALAAAQAQEEVFTAGELVYHGADYDVTLAYDENAKIPAAAELRVREIAKGTSEYNSYLKGAEAAAGKGVAEARFFDITIWAAGADGQQQEIQPQSAVRVNITYHKAIEVAAEGEVQAMHFEDGSADAEVVSADTNGGSEVSEIAFDAESFSVYGIVYTVDFTYDGYTYCIEGGSSIYLSELAQILGLYETDLDKAFSVGNVSNVSFTAYELVKIEKQADGDWLLTSLAPFTSEETLTIEMNDGVTFIVDVTDATGDEWTESSELVNFLTNAVISGATPQGGTYVVEPNKPYGITLTFKEGRQWQFANHSTLAYDMPAGMYIPDDQTKQLEIVVTSGGITYEADATLNITTDGKLTIKFDESDPEFPRLANANNVSLRAQFNACFDGSETTIRFSDSIEKEVIIDDDDHSDAFATKNGTFDETSGTYHYTIKVKATGNPQNVNVKDVISGTALIFNGDVQVTGNSSGYTTNPVTGKGFDYTFEEMQDGEEITITYSASLDPGEMAGADEITADMTKNTVTVRKEDGEPHNAEYSHQINLKTPDKSNGSEAGTTADGNKIYDWTIEYNKLALAGCAGDIVRDSIAIGSRDYMKYYGNITVKVYDHDGDLVDTRSFTPGSDAEWQYTVPGGDTTPYRYVFEYQTVVNQTAVDGLAAEMTLFNNTEGPGGTDIGAVVVSPKEKVTITKDVVTSNTDEVTWISHIHVPEDGLSQAVVTDRVPVFWNGRNNFDEFKDGSLVIDGLLPGESYSDPVVDGNLGTVTITFFKDSGQTQSGLQPAVGGHDITIKLTTKVNQEWLEIGYEEGGRKQDHVNTIGINGIETTATVVFAKPDIEKTGTEQANHKYMYTIRLTGVSAEPISIEDIFDTSILEFDSGNTAWNSLKIFGGNQWDQSAGGYPVNYSQTENGVLLTANSVPKQPNGEYYSHYKIIYFTKLKDGIDPEELAVENGGEYELSNTAIWGDHDSNFKFTYNYDALSKELITAATAENHYAYYKITFNPRHATLNNGQSFPMTDTLNEYLSIDHSSITITTDPAGVYVPYSISGEKDEYGNPTGGTVATYEIPDETAVTIEYRAMVVGTGTVTYKNTVEARGKSKYVEKDVDMGSSGGGEASQFSVKVVKVDGYDANKKLQGVQFKLYSSSGISLYPQDHPKHGQNWEILETDENGILDISYEKYGFSLVEDEKYYLEELEAAPDYQIISFPYQFTLTQNAENVNWDNYVYFNGETFQIKNWPLEGLVIEKIVDVEEPEPEGESYKTKEYSFKLEILDQDGNVDTSVNTKYGDYDFVEGSTTFTLKDKQQVSFWNMPKDTKFRVTETDSQGLVVWVGEGETSEKSEDGSYSGITKGEGEYTLVTFTNKKQEVGSLTISKSVVSPVPAEATKEFTFTIELSDNTVNGTFSGVQFTDGVATVIVAGGSPKTIEGLPEGVTYTVAEAADNDFENTKKEGETGSITAAGATAAFENTRKTGELEVTKTVVSSTASDKQKDFSFKVTLTPALSGTFGGMTFDENGIAEFTLKDGENMAATGLPVGYEYKVEEETAAGFVTTKTGDTGKISATVSTAAFKNTKDEGGLVVSKSVVSAVTADKTKDFSFEVVLTDKSINGTYGEMTFENGVAKFTLKDGETKSATGLPDAIGYVVSESSEPASDFIIISDGATGNFVHNETNTAEFTNTRKTGSLEISKTVVSPVPAEKDANYTFTVTLTNGEQKISGEYSGYYFDKNGQATVTVKGNASVTIEGLPVGTTYSVVESKYDNFDTESTGEAGDINDTKTSVAAFTNTRKTGSLVVTKTVINKNSVNTGRPFGFTVTLGGNTISGKFGDLTFNSGEAKFSLKDGEKAEANGLPTGVSYEVREETAEGFTTIKTGDTGDISEITATAAFTNTYLATGEVQMGARKALSGRPLEDAQFEFELFGPKGVSIDKKACDSTGAVLFKKISCTQDDMNRDEAGKLQDTEIIYTVKEVIPEGAKDNGDGTFTLNGYTYDGKEKEVKVTLHDNEDGTITAVQAPKAEELVFTNTYKAEGEIVLEAEKKLLGEKALEKDQFTFELRDESGKLIDSVKNDEDGKVTFKAIGYTQDNIYEKDDETGAYKPREKTSYKYTIREQIPKGAEEVDKNLYFYKGYAYDGTVYTITVELKDNGDGTLEVTKKIDNDGALKFVNEQLNVETSVTIGGVKVLKGQTLKKDEFKFVLADADGKWVAAATNDAEGNFTFKPISYKLSDLNGESAKVYTYSVWEVKGSENGITYDQKVYTVKVTVTDNGDGTLTAKADLANSDVKFVNTYTEKKSKTTSSKGSKTGDEAPLGVLFGGLGLGAAGLAVLLWYRRKKNKGKE